MDAEIPDPGQALLHGSDRALTAECRGRNFRGGPDALNYPIRLDCNSASPASF